MKAVVSFTDRREVEIDDRQAAEIAETVIRRVFALGDATSVSEDGRLITWTRDDRGRPEANLGRAATPSDRAALGVVMAIHNLK